MHMWLNIILLAAIIADAAAMFLAGERFMKWYFDILGCDYKKYNLRKVKISHTVTRVLLILMVVYVMVSGSRWNTLMLSLFLFFLVLNYLLIWRLCKKKD